MKKLTNEEFIKSANLVHNFKYDYTNTKYINSRSKVLINCLEHGEFYQLANVHLSGSGCPECGKKLQGPKKQTNEEFISRLKEARGDKYDYSLVEYKDFNEEIDIICPIHGNFKQLPYHHLNGTDCPLCSKSGTTYTTTQFIIRAKEVHGDLYDYSKVSYINSETNIIIICNKHGEFTQLPHNHINGCGCQKCGLQYRKAQSKLFNKLKKDLTNIEFLEEVSVDWLKPQVFDIYIPKYNIAIEYNGEQHYIPIIKFGGELGLEKTINRDIKKREKCIQNNCMLFEIRYDYKENDYEQLLGNLKLIIKSKENES